MPIRNVALGFIFGLAACSPAVPADTTTAPAISAITTKSPVAQHIANARAAFIAAQPVIWPNLPDASFQLILVEGETETLMCPQAPSTTFPAPDTDSVTGCATGTRARTYPADWLATFPAVDGVPTIVVGTPEATGQAPRRYELTLVHEHFHQIQMSQPGYGEQSLALGLSGGDETGMWMLNYAFPYETPEVMAAFKNMGTSLRAAIDARSTPDFPAQLKAYATARADVRTRVGETHWKYYELQVWQEGVARWFEIAAAATQPDHAATGEAMLTEIRTELAALDLAANQRVSFYALGAGEALVLDAASPAWRENYFAKPFQLATAFDAAEPR
jgi:hypothetical protein